MQRTNIFTIVTPSHLNQALCMIQSVLDNEHTANHLTKYQIYVLGACAPINLNLPDAVEMVYVEDVIDAETLSEIVERYTVAESCWALKPQLATVLLEQYERVFYVDADVLFYGGSEHLIHELEGADILLTPHYVTRFPQDLKSPNDLTLLRGGVFNAGFFGVRNCDAAFEFLDWWAHRVGEFGRNDPDNGMSGDQRWLDLVPVLFAGCKICRHPGFNVAYWNLHERTIECVNGEYSVNDQPLVFFHFSGFNPKNPNVLSAHQNRHNTENYKEIFEQYVRQLTEQTARVIHVNVQYKHRMWWHKHVKRYRWLLDKFYHPRKSRE